MSDTDGAGPCWPEDTPGCVDCFGRENKRTAKHCVPVNCAVTQTGVSEAQRRNYSGYGHDICPDFNVHLEWNSPGTEGNEKAFALDTFTTNPLPLRTAAAIQTDAKTADPTDSKLVSPYNVLLTWYHASRGKRQGPGFCLRHTRPGNLSGTLQPTEGLAC